MKRALYIVTAGLTLISVVLSPAVSTVLAANNSAPGTGQALEIAPPLENISGNPGQTIVLHIKLRDVAKTDLVVSGEINDFVANGEDGTPKIILDRNSDSPYSIRKWIGPLPTFTLQPKHIKDLQITINIPQDASPGGHYGVIRFTGTPPKLKGTGVSLSASLGTLVLLRVNGPVKEDLSIQEFSTTQDDKKRKLFEAPPIDFVEKIVNSGNIHEEPTGHITVKNMFGKTIAGLNVNLPPRNILPASTRKFSQPLDKTVLGGRRLFGRYTADLQLAYGSGKDRKIVNRQISFWVIPYKLIAAIILTLIILFFVFRFLIKRYNRRIIKKAQNSQKK
ncbi:MAG TPA: hypothetical protein VFW77_03330 [Candidatus Saccharimonadales bacterium]|nr:hypothetical protein [Candidatus Saccharimonadales bacterium]